MADILQFRGRNRPIVNRDPGDENDSYEFSPHALNRDAPSATVEENVVTLYPAIPALGSAPASVDDAVDYPCDCEGPYYA